MPPLPDGDLLLYDGSCGFCARSVQFVLHMEEKRGRGGAMMFATLAGPYGAEVRRRFPSAANADSVILYQSSGSTHGERALVRSDAALAVGSYLGGSFKLLASVARIFPRTLRDMVYRLIAKHRHQVAGAACLLPTEQQRSRFLDAG